MRGKGTCSLCKLRVQEGGGPVLPTETPYLSKEELENDVRLSCQVKVRNDLKIEIPEELFKIKEFRVSIEKVIDITDDIKSIQLKILTDEEGISFKPGQYVQLKVHKYKMTRESEYRAYSVASSSEESRDLELLITKVADGAVSTYVHDYMKEGEELTINGPYGEFYLQESEKDILLIATGSGLAPLLSILHQIEKEKIDRKTTLFFGARTVKDLLYYDEVKAFETRLPDFTFMPTLSRPTEEDRWQGEKGRVTNLIEKYISENAPLEVYICGSIVMVESCEDLLKKKGISEENIFYDKFE